MSRAARSILIFGLYLTGMGLGLVAAPNVVLGLLGLPPSAEFWPRVVGVLALVLAYYYVQAARHELTGFFRWTVAARIAVFAAFGVLALCGLAPAMLAVIGAVDLAAALWTAWTLRPQSMQ